VGNVAEDLITATAVDEAVPALSTTVGETSAGAGLADGLPGQACDPVAAPPWTGAACRPVQCPSAVAKDACAITCEESVMEPRLLTTVGNTALDATDLGEVEATCRWLVVATTL